MGVRRWKRIFHSVLFKYLASYVIVLIVPLLVLGYFGYDQLKATIGEQVRDNQQKLLNEVREDMDQKWTQMNQMASRLETHPMLTPYAISNYFAASYHSNPFLDYMVSNPYLQEIVYYIQGEPYLYASASTYPISLFMKDVYRFPNWNIEQMKQQLDEIKEPVLRPAEDVILANGTKERLISYIVPVPYGSTKPYGAVMFMIKEKNFLEYSRYMAGYERGSLLVISPDKRIIAAHKEDQISVENRIEQMPGHARQGAFSVEQINGEDYYQAVMESGSSGWNYVMLNPVKDEIGPMTSAVEQWIRTMLMILILGGVLIFAALYYNYSPIRKLVQLAEHYWGKAEDKINDLELVRTFMHRAVEKNRQLDEQMNENRYVIKQHMLLELLKGEIESLEEWNLEAEEIGIPFLHSHCICVLVVEYGEHNNKLKQTLQTEIEKRMSGDIQGYCRDTLDGQKLIVILAVNPEGDLLKHWLQQLHLDLQHQSFRQLVIGVGNTYEGLQHAGRSWIEASTAVDYKLIKGSNKVIYFEELGLEETDSFHYPQQGIDRLKLQIKQGQTDQVSETITKITQEISQYRTTLVVARCYCYDLITAIKNTVHEITLEHPELHIEFPDIWSLMDFTTVEELSSLMIDACVNLTTTIQQAIPHKKDQMMNEMTKYVQMHATQYHFSIQQMADDFHVSTSYLSRYYKEKTGSTLSELVNQIRIDEAKKMLREKDCPVKDIIQQVGYADPSSFTRKFKALVGLTPGEYRRLNSSSGD
ncbi:MULTISPECIES: helix-turn-helix domain-containing protein [unclassified Paenibacillus]|uniref:helix-turn-helix domain-containing protein n=1 Tax=unclassified Paenibacillus TaxID=185978 RepID=UPI002F3EB824